ncbi:hypothetical protein [Pseudofrankia asymbiotica]|uniref:Uncharacterized protein n=1 Tax=Pseudofrankia asymbiotica TaxID=1834516 RepID=A0A1V2I0E2_9ACTN|nr:hypothetical protein [Pseudofrankia asymbiotica]ONH22886.1 hypothetical protein BL253_34475 [Pseudofrankia asymbiotica]
MRRDEDGYFYFVGRLKEAGPGGAWQPGDGRAAAGTGPPSHRVADVRAGPVEGYLVASVEAASRPAIRPKVRDRRTEVPDG